jgi:hypothetical protein
VILSTESPADSSTVGPQTASATQIPRLVKESPNSVVLQLSFSEPLGRLWLRKLPGPCSLVVAVFRAINTSEGSSSKMSETCVGDIPAMAKLGTGELSS